PPSLAPAVAGAKAERCEPADKPGSVVGNHSSGTAVTSSLKQPTRKPAGRRCLPCGTLLPYLVLLRVGFTDAAACCHPRGALLPHLFTLAGAPAYVRCPWAVIFCGTFRRLAPPRRYLAPC